MSDQEPPSFDADENFKMPSLEEILNIIDTMKLSDAEKDQMKENLIKRHDAYVQGTQYADNGLTANNYFPFAMDNILIIFWMVMLLVIGNYFIQIQF